jgi:hypothetical protein
MKGLKVNPKMMQQWKKKMMLKGKMMKEGIAKANFKRNKKY